MYIKLINGSAVLKTKKQLQLEYPNTSFPDTFSNELLQELGLHKISFTSTPNVSTYEKAVLGDNWELQEDGTYARSWSVVPLSEQELLEKRNNMSISKLEFSLRLLNLGIISATEAEEYAGGNAIPQIAVSAIENSSLSAEEKAAARIKARGATLIERMDPFILLMQQILNMTNEQVDDLFASGEIT